jgi:hypothetical protein
LKEKYIRGEPRQRGLYVSEKNELKDECICPLSPLHEYLVSEKNELKGNISIVAYLCIITMV